MEVEMPVAPKAGLRNRARRRTSQLPFMRVPLDAPKLRQLGLQVGAGDFTDRRLSGQRRVVAQGVPKHWRDGLDATDHRGGHHVRIVALLEKAFC